MPAIMFSNKGIRVSFRAIPNLGWALPTTIPRKQQHPLIPPKRLGRHGSNIAMKRWIGPIKAAIVIRQWWAMPALPGSLRSNSGPMSYAHLMPH